MENAERSVQVSPGSSASETEAQVRAEERLATLGRIASRLSGALRQPLSVIRNAIYYVNLRLESAEDEKVRRHMGLMLKELKAVEAVADNLAVFSSSRTPQRQETYVDIAVAEAVRSVTRPDGVEIRTAVHPDATLFIDPLMLRLALANVISNGVQAMNGSGVVRVECRPDPEEVCIEVKDNGCGMTEPVAAMAVEPMFTTSERRLGIGLAAAKQAVASGGGVVEIESKPGEGTTVRLKFFRHDRAAEAARKEKREAANDRPRLWAVRAENGKGPSGNEKEAEG